MDSFLELEDEELFFCFFWTFLFVGFSVDVGLLRMKWEAMPSSSSSDELTVSAMIISAASWQRVVKARTKASKGWKWRLDGWDAKAETYQRRERSVDNRVVSYDNNMEEDDGEEASVRLCFALP